MRVTADRSLERQLDAALIQSDDKERAFIAFAAQEGFDFAPRAPQRVRLSSALSFVTRWRH
jgi:hypothetical protein